MIDDDEPGQVKKQATRWIRVSQRLSEIISEKKKKVTEAEEETAEESSPPRHGPRMKRAHTSAEIEAFDTEQAETDSATEKTQEEQAERETVQSSRKRKGKGLMRPAKSGKNAKETGKRNERKKNVVEPIQIPYEPESAEETEEEVPETEEAEEKEVPMYHKMLDNHLKAEIGKFKDRKLHEDHHNRAYETKQMKSGKRLHVQSPQDLGIEERFRAHFEAIGFKCLLDIEDEEVPVELAQEFFTSFKFKAAADPDAKCIVFRVYNRELRMSLNEWSVRMGLYTVEEAMEGVWDDCDVGLLSYNVEFSAQDAWMELTTKGVGRFKTSQSKGYHIADPALQFAQVYLGYNLLGQVNSSATKTTSELYLVWCMNNKIKVHLGFWLAHSIHQSRSPYAGLPSPGGLNEKKHCDGVEERHCCPAMVSPPCLFDIKFFINVSLVKLWGNEPQLYEAGVADWSAGKKEETDEDEPAADWKKDTKEVLLTLVQTAKDLKDALLTNS